MPENNTTNADSDASESVKLDEASAMIHGALSSGQKPAAADSSRGGEASQPAAEGAQSNLKKPVTREVVEEVLSRLDALENSKSALEKKSQAEDFTDSYIRSNCDGIPRAITRKFLPVTTDEKKLVEAKRQMEDALNEFVKERMAQGFLQAGPKARDFGGVRREGGTTPADNRGNENLSATDLILQGLR